jgi:polyisoprenoid-binding protein YceI
MKKSLKKSTFVALLAVALPVAALPLLSTQAQSKDNTKPVLATVAKPASLPDAITGTWKIDPAHSTIGFAVRHVMINDVHGTFNEFEGTIKADAKKIANSSVEFTAKVDSIDTRVAPRDAHLKSPDFFDAKTYPELTFKSTRVLQTSSGFHAIGILTIRGTSKVVTIPFKISGPVKDGFGTIRIGVDADLQINRQDYGVKYSQTLDNGGLAVDNIVRINLDLEATKVN